MTTLKECVLRNQTVSFGHQYMVFTNIDKAVGFSFILQIDINQILTSSEIPVNSAAAASTMQ